MLIKEHLIRKSIAKKVKMTLMMTTVSKKMKTLIQEIKTSTKTTMIRAKKRKMVMIRMQKCDLQQKIKKQKKPIKNQRKTLKPLVQKRRDEKLLLAC